MKAAIKQAFRRLPPPVQASGHKLKSMARGLLQPGKLARTVGYHAGLFARRKSKFEGLHVGSGGIMIPGYLNVDADLFVDCDVVAGLERLKIASGSVGCIYASHVLEHIPRSRAPQVLQEWYRVLAPGGKLFLCVPDLEVLIRIYLDNLPAYGTDGSTYKVDLANVIMYGGQTDKYDFHCSGYSFTTLNASLRSLGFKSVDRFDRAALSFAPFVDAGFAEIEGVPISLNVVAVK